MPAGINFREDKQGESFGDGSPFLLHVVEKQNEIGKNLQFNLTSK